MKRRVNAPKTPASKKRRIVPKTKMQLASPYTSKSLNYRATLRYVDTIAYNVGVSGQTTNVFTSNGLYDPDITGVGHQPNGFDQIMALWNEYIVISCRIKCVITSQDANSYSATFGITHCDFSTATTDYRKYMENGNTVWNKQGGRGAEPLTLTNYVNISKISSQSILSDESYVGNSGANPTDTHFWHVWMQTDGAVDAGNFYVTVEIAYDAIFRDPALTDLS